jgi:hypothetical protein
MERLWTNAEREPLRGLEPGALPMSQEEALSIVKAVAVKYATDQPVAGQLEDWVAGCTDDFDD